MYNVSSSYWYFICSSPQSVSSLFFQHMVLKGGGGGGGNIEVMISWENWRTGNSIRAFLQIWPCDVSLSLTLSSPKVARPRGHGFPEDSERTISLTDTHIPVRLTTHTYVCAQLSIHTLRNTYTNKVPRLWTGVIQVFSKQGQICSWTEFTLFQVWCSFFLSGIFKVSVINSYNRTKHHIAVHLFTFSIHLMIPLTNCIIITS